MAYHTHGQKFLSWTGDATGTNFETSVVMKSDKFVTAHFTHNLTLELASFMPLRFTGVGVAGDVYQFQASTNLLDWVPILIATNFSGSVQFSDPDSFIFPNRMYRGLKE